MQVSEAAICLKELASPVFGERVKRAIERAAGAVGFTYWRTFDLWYSKARRVEQFEVDAIKEALQRKRSREAANELHELRTRLAILESRLVQGDSDFYRPQIDFLGRSACRSS
jgi:hypothetical protein